MKSMLPCCMWLVKQTEFCCTHAVTVPCVRFNSPTTTTNKLRTHGWQATFGCCTTSGRLALPLTCTLASNTCRTAAGNQTHKTTATHIRTWTAVWHEFITSQQWFTHMWQHCTTVCYAVRTRPNPETVKTLVRMDTTHTLGSGHNSTQDATQTTHLHRRKEKHRNAYRYADEQAKQEMLLCCACTAMREFCALLQLLKTQKDSASCSAALCMCCC
jgi:hypothetical protein